MTIPTKSIPTYPVIQFIVRHGSLLAFAFALLPMAWSVHAFMAGAGVTLLLAGVVAAVVVWGFLSSYVEILKVMADTLMPR